MLGEKLPHAARCALHQIFERHAIGVQQAQDVVVRLNDERRRLGERRVLGENARIHVAVGGDDRKRARFLVQRARDASY